MSAKRETVEILQEPARPLRTRVPFEGPSPREYQLLAFASKRPLTKAETAELQVEQDTRTEHEANWAEYHEKLRAYQAQQARIRSE